MKGEVTFAKTEPFPLYALMVDTPRSPLCQPYTDVCLGLAYYRRQGSFIGVDGARSQIEIANTRKSELELSNIEFVHSDFLTAGQQLSGQFDFIIAHGVFSWVPQDVRDALLELCAKHLSRGGLLYLNYNTRPGWNVRGMVREFLLAQTAGTASLQDRAHEAQDVAAKVVASLTVGEHPYSQLLSNEFRFVCENHVSYVAHEFPASDNHAYWRSEFLELTRRHGLEYVADADFNYPSGRMPEDLSPRLSMEGIVGRGLDDTVDFLCYRQLHSPILTKGSWTRNPPAIEEFSNLYIASCLAPCAVSETDTQMFQHPSGYQVEAKEEVIRTALTKLQPLWPRGVRIGKVFPNITQVIDDLKLLHRNGLIELRCIEPGVYGACSARLNKLEAHWGEYVTTPYHTREAVPSEFGVDGTYASACPQEERFFSSPSG